jgi:hypothetical protein
LSDVLVFLIVLAILVAVVAVVSAPLRRAGSGSDRVDGDQGPSPADTARGPRANGGQALGGIANSGPGDAAAIDELEAAREAKYREIRDAELDHETGKLSDQDFEAIDRSLRAEAIEILHALDRVRGL